MALQLLGVPHKQEQSPGLFWYLSNFRDRFSECNSFPSLPVTFFVIKRCAAISAIPVAEKSSTAI